MTPRTTIALLIAGGAVVFGAVACGGNDNSSAGGTTTTEATTTEETTIGEIGGSNTLQGETGPGFTIEVSQNGKDADTVKAGTYTLEVEDKSDMHNFHLLGCAVAHSPSRCDQAAREHSPNLIEALLADRSAKSGDVRRPFFR